MNVREILEKHATQNGELINWDGLEWLEYIQCNTEIVSSERTSNHRWYDVHWIVGRLVLFGTEYFIGYEDYELEGNTEIEDVAYDWTIETHTRLVKPVKKMVTVYE